MECASVMVYLCSVLAWMTRSKLYIARKYMFYLFHYTKSMD